MHEKMQFFCFGPEIPLLGKFGPKIQNYQFKLKFASRLIRICGIQWWCSLYLFSTGNTLFGQIWSKIPMVTQFFRICRIQWRCSLFSVLELQYPFLGNVVQKIEIDNVSRNLIPRLIRICIIQWWCSLFSFSTENTLLEQIWSKNSALSV